MKVDLDAPVEWNTFDIGTRAYNALVNNDVRTMRDLLKLKPKEMLKWKNFGRGSLKEIQEELSRRGLKLSDADAVTCPHCGAEFIP